MKIGRPLLVVTLAAAIAGCEPQAECPFPASDCPTGCAPIDVMQVDDVRGCRFKTRLGCTSSSWQFTISVCYRNVDDGRIVATTGYALSGRPEWRLCDAADAERRKAAQAICESPKDGGA